MTETERSNSELRNIRFIRFRRDVSGYRIGVKWASGTCRGMKLHRFFMTRYGFSLKEWLRWQSMRK